MQIGACGGRWKARGGREGAGGGVDLINLGRRKSPVASTLNTWWVGKGGEGEERRGGGVSSMGFSLSLLVYDSISSCFLPLYISLSHVYFFLYLFSLFFLSFIFSISSSLYSSLLSLILPSILPYFLVLYFLSLFLSYIL